MGPLPDLSLGVILLAISAGVILLILLNEHKLQINKRQVVFILVFVGLSVAYATAYFKPDEATLKWSLLIFLAVYVIWLIYSHVYKPMTEYFQEG